MGTITQDRIADFRGQDLYDSDGDKIGAVDEINVDDATVVCVAAE